MTLPHAEMLRAQIKHAEEMIEMLTSGQSEHHEVASEDRSPLLSVDLIEQYRRVIETCRAMLDEMKG